MAKQRVTLTDEEKLQIGRLLGWRIKELVYEKFKTNKSFLHATGISERQYFRFRRGGNPGLHMIYLFAKALDVTLKELFEFDTSAKVRRWDDEPGVKEYYKQRYPKRKKRDESEDTGANSQ